MKKILRDFFNVFLVFLLCIVLCYAAHANAEETQLLTNEEYSIDIPAEWTIHASDHAAFSADESEVVLLINAKLENAIPPELDKEVLQQIADVFEEKNNYIYSYDTIMGKDICFFSYIEEGILYEMVALVDRDNCPVIAYEVAATENKEKTQKKLISYLQTLKTKGTLVLSGTISGGSSLQEKTEMVTVKECGYAMSGKYYYYSFIAHNNMKDKAVMYPEFRITIRNKNGELVSTQTQTLNVLYPDQDIAYAFLGEKIDEKPASIEVSFIEPVSSDWHIVKPSQLDHAEYTPMEAKNVKVKGKKAIGEIYNPNKYGMSTIAITIIFRGKDGNVLGGETTFVSNIQAGETIPFQMSIDSKLIQKDYEVFVQPW